MRLSLSRALKLAGCIAVLCVGHSTFAEEEEESNEDVCESRLKAEIPGWIELITNLAPVALGFPDLHTGTQGYFQARLKLKHLSDALAPLLRNDRNPANFAAIEKVFQQILTESASLRQAPVPLTVDEQRLLQAYRALLEDILAYLQKKLRREEAPRDPSVSGEPSENGDLSAEQGEPEEVPDEESESKNGFGRDDREDEEGGESSEETPAPRGQPPEGSPQTPPKKKPPKKQPPPPEKPDERSLADSIANLFQQLHDKPPIPEEITFDLDDDAPKNAPPPSDLPPGPSETKAQEDRPSNSSPRKPTEPLDETETQRVLRAFLDKTWIQTLRHYGTNHGLFDAIDRYQKLCQQFKERFPNFHFIQQHSDRALNFILRGKSYKPRYTNIRDLMLNLNVLPERDPVAYRRLLLFWQMILMEIGLHEKHPKEQYLLSLINAELNTAEDLEADVGDIELGRAFMSQLQGPLSRAIIEQRYHSGVGAPYAWGSLARDIRNGALNEFLTMMRVGHLAEMIHIDLFTPSYSITNTGLREPYNDEPAQIESMHDLSDLAQMFRDAPPFLDLHLFIAGEARVPVHREPVQNRIPRRDRIKNISALLVDVTGSMQRTRVSVGDYMEFLERTGQDPSTVMLTLDGAANVSPNLDSVQTGTAAKKIVGTQISVRDYAAQHGRDSKLILPQEKHLLRNAVVSAFLDRAYGKATSEGGEHIAYYWPMGSREYDPERAHTLAEAQDLFNRTLNYLVGADTETKITESLLRTIRRVKVEAEVGGEFSQISVLVVTDGLEPIDLAALRAERETLPSHVDLRIYVVNIAEKNDDLKELTLIARSAQEVSNEDRYHFVSYLDLATLLNTRMQLELLTDLAKKMRGAIPPRSSYVELQALQTAFNHVDGMSVGRGGRGIEIPRDPGPIEVALSGNPALSAYRDFLHSPLGKGFPKEMRAQNAYTFINALAFEYGVSLRSIADSLPWGLRQSLTEWLE